MPEDLVVHERLREIVAESKRLSAALTSKTENVAKTRSQKQKESKPFVGFSPGQLVLLQKLFYEKGRGGGFCRSAMVHSSFLACVMMAL